MPLTNVVLPAPKSPLSKTNFGGFSDPANFRPSAIVSSGDWVVNSRVSIARSVCQSFSLDFEDAIPSNRRREAAEEYRLKPVLSLSKKRKKGSVSVVGSRKGCFARRLSSR